LPDGAVDGIPSELAGIAVRFEPRIRKPILWPLKWVSSDNCLGFDEFYQAEIIMKVAIASQNRKTVTANAGRCRRFCIYDIESNTIKRKTLIELPVDQSFHATQGKDSPELQGIQVLITSGMGEGLAQRLKEMGIESVITEETDPDAALAGYLQKTGQAR
jgi:predicted Fe-Mo cluster-binding NifX family protein